MVARGHPGRRPSGAKKAGVDERGGTGESGRRARREKIAVLHNVLRSTPRIQVFGGVRFIANSPCRSGLPP